MKGPAYVIGSRAYVIGSRTCLQARLSAGVLAVLVLACTGAAAGATWVVDDDGGAGVDFCDDTGGDMTVSVKR